VGGAGEGRLISRPMLADSILGLKLQMLRGVLAIVMVNPVRLARSFVSSTKGIIYTKLQGLQLLYLLNSCSC